jgi:hypothetical protein
MSTHESEVLVEPQFDESAPYAIVANGDSEADVTQTVRFIQDGQWYNAARRWIPDSSRPVREPLAVEEPIQVQQQKPLTPGDIDKLCATSRGKDLLGEGRDVITQLVREAGGAIAAGDGSTRYMVAWLVRNTQ